MGGIQQPAGFVPLHAMAFGSADAAAVAVDAANPLPVVAVAPLPRAPLAGTIAASGTVGPFVPLPGLPIWLTLSGSWTGTVRVLRSVDGGATRLPLTVAGQDWASFAGNAQEIVGEEGTAGAAWFLQVALEGGTLTYRVAQ